MLTQHFDLGQILRRVPVTEERLEYHGTFTEGFSPFDLYCCIAVDPAEICMGGVSLSHCSFSRSCTNITDCNQSLYEY